ncbi:MAG: UDP-N-acetylmuramoyl-tripeptide--D-alanyl-D-alanine ligase [Gemmatimonadetes bacterium]|nr:UDP-N-acetylmuramoyl-tripeptide--D-alanyl-D-alanine ligase [Gemmatimonadota bacterium]
MSIWSLDRVVAALGPLLIGARPAGGTPLRSVSTDTRSLGAGDLFVALVGERFDGHAFVDQAVEAGAAALVVSDPRAAAGAGVPVFVVEDTTAALGALGRWWRRTWGGRVVAVAGSNGKTSTKGMLAAVLGQQLRVHATVGNLNNQVGVPLTLLSIPPEADLAVVEVGTNHPGEVAALRDLVEPDVAVITSIGEEHLEGFGSLAGVLQEEVSIALGVPTVVVPAAQPEVGEAARRFGGAVIEAGVEGGTVRPEAWGVDGDGHGWLQVGEHRATLTLVGAHNVRNACLAVAVARVCGVDDAHIAGGLAATPAAAMRSVVERLGTLRIYNDAYNANPASAREALASMDAMEGTMPRVVVLGSMLELGAESDGLHDAIARRALASRADVIAAVGAFADAFARVAPADPRVVAAPDVAAVWPTLRPRVAPDSLVLLKGSRGTRLERLLPELAVVGGASAPVQSH